MAEYNWLPLSTVKKFEPLAKRSGVSKVARGPGGFLPAYKRAKGLKSAIGEKWRKKRNAFISRHMAQVKKDGERLWADGMPTRRHLALIMWGYSPHASKVKKWRDR